MSTPIEPQTLTIDVISDVVCPWCYIGRRRLGAAIELLGQRKPDVVPVVSWHPFQLNPDLPPEGVDRSAYLAAKFGDAEEIERVRARVSHIGRDVGIDFAFERIGVQPNTLAAHRLVSWAQSRGSAEEVVERLFRAFFVEGRNVGEHAALVAIASEAGFDAGEAEAMLASGDGRRDILAMDRRVRELGVSGVPFFIFGGRVAVEGAHAPETLADAMLQALEAPVA